MHFQSRTLLVLVAVAAATAACQGCQKQTTLSNPTLVATHDRLVVRERVTDLLEDMFFEVERPPRDQDRIDTLPLVSAHPTEFWRPDVRTFEDSVESSLHTVRRTVTVFMREPGDAEASTDGSPTATAAPTTGTGLSVEVIVRKERLAVAGAIDATSAGDMYSVYRGRVRAIEDYEKNYGVGETWVDYGRDEALEQYILQKILKRIG